MKFNLRYLANLFVAALLFCATGCKDDDTSGPEMPAVKIAPGATTASSISFTATPEYADAAAYVCVEKGMLIPSAENILANGTALTLDKESLVEVKNLKDTTVYVVAAAAKMGDQIGNVVSVEIKTGAYDGVLNIIDATQSVISSRRRTAGIIIWPFRKPTGTIRSRARALRRPNGSRPPC